MKRKVGSGFTPVLVEIESGRVIRKLESTVVVLNGG